MLIELMLCNRADRSPDGAACGAIREKNVDTNPGCAASGSIRATMLYYSIVERQSGICNPFMRNMTSC